ncbi:MAG TPA: hypothetical protein VE984_09650 [Gaiellaceae bacterium]|nr:hypothetical protein [Gaiellaceae bacterium]
MARGRASGDRISLAGISLLRFDDSGRVVEQRDYWGEKPGVSEPFPGS